MSTPRPDELVTFAAGVDPARLRLPDGRGPVLIEALDGFVDAGAARRLAREHLLGSTESEVVATFDVDALHDYRARRPIMLFVGDHWESYDAPRLEVRLLHDAVGTPYLLLTGPEPDVLWERFAAAVRLVTERLGVRLTLGTNAIPMAVPHTRPTGVTAHASRRELLGDTEQWVGTVQVPASAGHLVEHRLAEAGHDAGGFAVHVPHYLAQAAYPEAALTLVRELGRVGELRLPVDGLEESAREASQTIDSLVAQSEELRELVSGLENQYDAFVAGRQRSLLADDADLPTADELGAELERFLAEQAGRGDEPRP